MFISTVLKLGLISDAYIEAFVGLLASKRPCTWRMNENSDAERWNFHLPIVANSRWKTGELGRLSKRVASLLLRSPTFAFDCAETGSVHMFCLTTRSGQAPWICESCTASAQTGTSSPLAKPALVLDEPAALDGTTANRRSTVVCSPALACNGGKLALLYLIGWGDVIFFFYVLNVVANFHLLSREPTTHLLWIIALGGASFHECTLVSVATVATGAGTSPSWY